VSVEVVGWDEGIQRDGDDLVSDTALGWSEHGDGSAGVGTRAGRCAAAAYDESRLRKADFCKTLLRFCDSEHAVSHGCGATGNRRYP
jgi:hypothetical protein